MSDQIIQKELEILSEKELNRTIKRLASQILEKVPDTSSTDPVGCTIKWKINLIDL